MTTEKEERNKVSPMIVPTYCLHKFPGYGTESGNPGEVQQCPGIEEVTGLGSQSSKISQDKRETQRENFSDLQRVSL